SVLIAVDLPALERPTKAISGKARPGRCSSCGALMRKCAVGSHARALRWRSARAGSAAGARRCGGAAGLRGGVVMAGLRGWGAIVESRGFAPINLRPGMKVFAPFLLAGPLGAC